MTQQAQRQHARSFGLGPVAEIVSRLSRQARHETQPFDYWLLEGALPDRRMSTPSLSCPLRRRRTRLQRPPRDQQFAPGLSSPRTTRTVSRLRPRRRGFNEPDVRTASRRRAPIFRTPTCASNTARTRPASGSSRTPTSWSRSSRCWSTCRMIRAPPPAPTSTKDRRISNTWLGTLRPEPRRDFYSGHQHLAWRRPPSDTGAPPVDHHQLRHVCLARQMGARLRGRLLGASMHRPHHTSIVTPGFIPGAHGRAIAYGQTPPLPALRGGEGWVRGSHRVQTWYSPDRIDREHA